MRWVKGPLELTGGNVVMDCGLAMRLSVDDDGDEPWQHFSLTFWKFEKERTFDECLRTWPREAIAEARRRLDEFEKKLDKEEP